MTHLDNVDKVYEYVLKKVSSPEFRNKIKDFIDENCSHFLDIEENTFQQGGLFNEFIMLVDNLLEKLCKDSQITEEMFLLAAKKGLEDEKNKKYFEQLIAYNNYNYFKSIMTKRNYQIIALVEKEMEKKEKNKKLVASKKQLKEIMDKEMQQAIKMSLALEDEKRRIEAIEEEDLRRAIKLSLEEANKKFLPVPVDKKNEKKDIKNDEKKNIKKDEIKDIKKENKKDEKKDFKKNEKKDDDTKNKFVNKSNIVGNVGISLSSNFNTDKGNPNVKEESKIKSSGKGFGSQINSLKSQYGLDDDDNKNKSNPNKNKQRTFKDINVSENFENNNISKIKNKDNNIDSNNNKDNQNNNNDINNPNKNYKNKDINISNKNYTNNDINIPNKNYNNNDINIPNKNYTNNDLNNPNDNDINNRNRNINNNNNDIIYNKNAYVPISQQKPSSQIAKLNPNKKYTNTENIKNENLTPTPKVNDIPINKKVENNPVTKIEIKPNQYINKPKEEKKSEPKIEKKEKIIDPIFDSLLDDEQLNPETYNVNMGKVNFDSNKKEETKKESAASIIKKSLENNQNQYKKKNEPIKNSFFQNSDKLNTIKKEEGGLFSKYGNKDYIKGNYTDLESQVNKKIGSVIEKNDENYELEKKTDEIEKERNKKMLEYREKILQMKKEEREKKAHDYLIMEKQND